MNDGHSINLNFDSKAANEHKSLATSSVIYHFNDIFGLIDFHQKDKITDQVNYLIAIGFNAENTIQSILMKKASKKLIKQTKLLDTINSLSPYYFLCSSNPPLNYHWYRTFECTYHKLEEGTILNARKALFEDMLKVHFLKIYKNNKNHQIAAFRMEPTRKMCERKDDPVVKRTKVDSRTYIPPEWCDPETRAKPEFYDRKTVDMAWTLDFQANIYSRDYSSDIFHEKSNLTMSDLITPKYRIVCTNPKIQDADNPYHQLVLTFQKSKDLEVLNFDIMTDTLENRKYDQYQVQCGQFTMKVNDELGDYLTEKIHFIENIVADEKNVLTLSIKIFEKNLRDVILYQPKKLK